MIAVTTITTLDWEMELHHDVLTIKDIFEQAVLSQRRRRTLL